jgi:hypothetical protein
MLELTFDKHFDYLGEYDIPMSVYRKADGLANSELQMFITNPSSYIWNKTAPRDMAKATTADVGTCLHTKLLEPHLYDDEVIVSDIKGRSSSSFRIMQTKNPTKIIITEAEANQIDIMARSAMSDPMFRSLIDMAGACESSIFVDDPMTGLRLKIRPDKVGIVKGQHPLLIDVKTSASLDEWRSDKPWLNPLFKFGYGFTAAYYIYVASILYGVELDRYVFLVAQKQSMLGRYPASTFVVTKDELVDLGFWDEMISALNDFATHKENNDWMTYEKFPEFPVFNSESIDIKFED